MASSVFFKSVPPPDIVRALSFKSGEGARKAVACVSNGRNMQSDQHIDHEKNARTHTIYTTTGKAVPLNDVRITKRSDMDSGTVSSRMFFFASDVECLDPRDVLELLDLHVAVCVSFIG